MTHHPLVNRVQCPKDVLDGKLTNLLLAVSADLPSLNLCPALILFDVEEGREILQVDMGVRAVKCCDLRVFSRICG